MKYDWQAILFTSTLHGILLVLMLGWQLMPKKEITVPDYVRARLVQLDPKAKPVSDFIKELGLKPEVTDKKIIIKAKDLPQEETKLYILEKNY